MSAIEENIADPEENLNFHLVTEYDNVSKKAVPKIRKWLLEQGSMFQKKVSRYLSQFDQDINPDLNGDDGGVRVVCAGFSRIKFPDDK